MGPISPIAKQHVVRSRLEKHCTLFLEDRLLELVAGELCRQNEQLMREVAGLSDQITVEVLNLAIDRARAEAYGVDQVPAIVVEGSRDWGIRFYGIPLGYEFSNLIDSIIVASTGEPALT